MLSSVASGSGMSAIDKAGTPLPDATLESIRRTGLALKGPLTTPVGGGYRSVNVALRQEFDLYANVRPRSEEHTSELQSRLHLVCRLLLEKKKQQTFERTSTTKN